MLRPRGEMQRRYVLVVDDDEAIRGAVAEALREAGFDVECAGDGYEALAAMQLEPRPSVVLLDLMMPRLSGWQVLDVMAEKSRLKEVPVVVLTAFDALADLPPGRRVLHKPFDEEVLREMVHQTMREGVGARG